MTPPTPHVRIWRQPDGLWRWHYVEPGADGRPELTLTGHRAYESKDAARSSARAAFPGVDLQFQLEPQVGTTAPKPAPRWQVVAVLVLVFVLRRRSRARHSG